MRFLRGFLPAWILLFTAVVRAQTPEIEKSAPVRLRVFIDCQYQCDVDYLRQNIEFIDYVRDRATADVHVLVTTQDTGGGGISWNLNFIGLDFFMGRNQRLKFTTPQTFTDDDRRREFARNFKVGLISYAAETSVAPSLDVAYKKVEGGNDSRSVVHDPWNYWVFRGGLDFNMNGEQSSSNGSYHFNFSGNRTTEEWKTNVNVNADTNQSRFNLSDGEIVKSNTDGWSLNSLMVKSWGPKWSYGARNSVSHSSFSNQNRAVGAYPALEYDVFPYSESTRRRWSFQYAAGATYYQYSELTIFNKLHETVPTHSISTSLGLRAPWGSLSGSLNVSQHLNHLDRYHVSLYTNTDIRLFKGFSFNINGGYEKIGDQIGLRKGEVSEQASLLKLQQQASGYSYFVYGGFSYSFGSIFNSIVNSRF